MKTLEITARGVEFYDVGRQLQRPELGAVVAIQDPTVARTLIEAGRAVEVRESAGALERPDRATEESVAGGGAAPQTWADVDGLSKPSLKLLEENLPDADPLDVDDATLLEALDGSTGRTSKVKTALARAKAAAEQDGNA